MEAFASPQSDFSKLVNVTPRAFDSPANGRFLSPVSSPTSKGLGVVSAIFGGRPFAWLRLLPERKPIDMAGDDPIEFLDRLHAINGLR